MKRFVLIMLTLMTLVCMGCAPTIPEENNELYDLKYQIISGDDEHVINIRMVNKTNGDIVLNYTSGQRYDYHLLQDDQIVYTWSDGMMFTQALEDKVLKSGEYEEYTIDLNDVDIEEGEYILEFFSTADRASELPHLKIIVSK